MCISLPSKGRFIGRFDLNRRTGHEGWHPDKKLLKLTVELEKQDRL